MSRRMAVVVAVVAVLFLAGCGVGYQPGGEDSGPDPRPEQTETVGPAGATPTDPAELSDAGELGQYNGYLHNDTLDVDPSDGLTDEEATAVFSRAMARVQLLRGLTFDEDLDIELVTRAEFREEFGGEAWPEPGPGDRALDNAQYEALFLVGPDTDVIDVRHANRGDLVLGFYQPEPERLVIVSGQDPATLDDEITLAHELVHALQDQHVDLASLRNARTLDGVNARNGLVEGGAVVVEQNYARHCESGAWECVQVGDGHQSVRPGADFHFGVYFVSFFPYAEGPSFVSHARERGGWAAVNAMYDDFPTAAAEIVYPYTYGADAYGEATIEDRNAAEWKRVRSDDGPDYAVVGQSGLAATFAYTAFHEPNRQGVIEQDDFQNVGADGRLDPVRPFTYDVTYAEGWYADRLHAYEADGDRAHLWNVTFNDEANATEFREGYEQVFEYWGGEHAGSQAAGDVWTFDDDGEFRGAVWIERDGSTVTVVAAPGVEDLEDVYAPAG